MGKLKIRTFRKIKKGGKSEGGNTAGWAVKGEKKKTGRPREMRNLNRGRQVHILPLLAPAEGTAPGNWKSGKSSNHREYSRGGGEIVKGESLWWGQSSPWEH